MTVAAPLDLRGAAVHPCLRPRDFALQPGNQGGHAPGGLVGLLGERSIDVNAHKSRNGSRRWGNPKYQQDSDPRTSGLGFAVTNHPAALEVLRRWRSPRFVFVNSMSDHFPCQRPDRARARRVRLRPAARVTGVAKEVRRPRHCPQRVGGEGTGIVALVSASVPTAEAARDRLRFRARHMPLNSL